MSGTGAGDTELKAKLLELLRSDWEFRRAVAAELGLLEILERLDRLEERMEEHSRVTAEHAKATRELQEQVAYHSKVLEEHTKAIRELQEQVKALQEQVAEHSRAIRQLQEQVARLQEQMDRFDKRLAALGARWGLYSERALREALYELLQKRLGVARVEKWYGFDEHCEVFPKPRPVEIDVVVKDDTHYLIELKSSISAYDVYMFYHKCEFYTKKVKPKKTEKIIVTYWADEEAKTAAQELGIRIIAP